MLETILIMMVCAALSAAVAGSVLSFCAKKNFFSHQYVMRYDAFLYLLVVLFVGTLCAFWLTPHGSDAIVDPSLLKCVYGFVAGAGLYVYSLFDEKKLFKPLVALASFVGAFLNISPEANIVMPFLPPMVLVILSGFLMTLFALSCGVLSKLIGVFETVMSVVLGGMILLYSVNGLPLYIALGACVWLGVLLVLRQMNISQNSNPLAPHMCTVIAFVFAMTFMTAGVNELCFSSMMILMAYPICEGLFSLIAVYVLRRIPRVAEEQTVYFGAVQKGLPQETLQVALFKINIMNILLAGFQVFSPNAFTLPLIALVFDAWLMRKMYYFDEPDLTLKSANKEVVQNVKKSLREINKKTD